MSLTAKFVFLSKTVPYIFLATFCLIVPTFADPVSPLTKSPLNRPLLSPNDLSLNPNALYSFRDAYTYAPYGYLKAHAVLSVTPLRLRQVRQGADPSGEQFTVDIRLYNDSGETCSFYNLDWNPFIPMPGRLVLYDSQKHYVCDLLERMGRSRATIASYSWADLPASSYIGKILYESLPYPTYKVLPAGTYYLQVIYLPRVVQSFSVSNSSTFKYNENTELFRSNAVSITVVNEANVKTLKPASTP